MSWLPVSLVVRLGWTLIHFLWEGALLAGLLALALWLAVGRSSRLRYGLACLTLGLMALSPMATWLWLGRAPRPAEPPPVLVQARVLEVQAPAGQASAAPTELPRPGSSLTWLPACVALWMVGVSLLSLRLAGSWAWLQWLRRRPETVPAGDDLQLRLLRLCQRMNLASNIRLLLCERVPGPTVMGWLRPVILVPPAALLGMPPDQMELVLTHELAHILRHDFAINLIQSCVEVLLFYHPAVWWVTAKIRQEREQCCDDLAVRTTGDALDYAAALTRLEALCRPPVPPRPAAGALAATGGSFMHRIQRLISPIAPTPLAPRAGLVLLLLAGAVGLRAAHPVGAPIQTLQRELVLRRYNQAPADGSARAGQVAFEGVEVPAGFGLQALGQLMALPVAGPITELKLPVPASTPAQARIRSFNFPAVDPDYLRQVLTGLHDEKRLSLDQCPPHGVIIRRFNAATQKLSPLPGLSTISVVANQADVAVVSAALSDLMQLKPTPYLFQQVQRCGSGDVPKDRQLTIDLHGVSPDRFRMVLDARKGEAAPVPGR